MDENSLIFLMVLVWIGIGLCIGGLIAWWGAFKVPENHVGIARGSRIYAAGWHFQPQGRLMKIVVVDLPGLENRVIQEMKSSVEDLTEEVDSVADKIGVTYAVDFRSSVRTFIESNKEDLLLGTANMEPLAMKVRTQISGELSQLRSANDVYQQALAAYETAATAVHQSGSGSLLRRIDRSHNGLFSTNWEQLIDKRMWAEFNDIMKGAIKEFQELGRLATSSRSTDADAETTVHMSEKQALAILGLQKGATPEAIKKAYREAVKKFNVDQRQNLEAHIRNLVEDKFKEVNEAYRSLTNRT